MRVNLALLHRAESDFLGKLNSWFDQTVDRASEVFTRKVRWVTGAIALLLALVLQLDAIGLINRLSVDAPLRDRLVQTAIHERSAWQAQIAASRAQANASAAAAANSSAGSNATAGAATANATGGNASEGNASEGNASEGNASVSTGNASACDPATANAVAGGNAADGNSVTASSVPAANCAPARPRDAQADEQAPLRQARSLIEELGIVTMPGSYADWLQSWSWQRLFGILLAAALLSLGAPFWYATLANLLKLRSVIAGKDEEQREERQTTQTEGPLTRPIVVPPATASPAPPPPPPAPAPAGA